MSFFGLFGNDDSKKEYVYLTVDEANQGTVYQSCGGPVVPVCSASRGPCLTGQQARVECGGLAEYELVPAVSGQRVEVERQEQGLQADDFTAEFGRHDQQAAPQEQIEHLQPVAIRYKMPAEWQRENREEAPVKKGWW